MGAKSLNCISNISHSFGLLAIQGPHLNTIDNIAIILNIVHLSNQLIGDAIHTSLH